MTMHTQSYGHHHNGQKTFADKEILTLLLQQQKHLAHEYNQTISHTGDFQMLQTLAQILIDEQKTRLEIYEAMHARGWYNPKIVDQAQIDSMRQKANQRANQLQQAIAQASQGAGHRSYSTTRHHQPVTF